METSSISDRVSRYAVHDSTHWDSRYYHGRINLSHPIEWFRECCTDVIFDNEDAKKAIRDYFSLKNIRVDFDRISDIHFWVAYNVLYETFANVPLAEKGGVWKVLKFSSCRRQNYAVTAPVKYHYVMDGKVSPNMCVVVYTKSHVVENYLYVRIDHPSQHVPSANQNHYTDVEQTFESLGVEVPELYKKLCDARKPMTNHSFKYGGESNMVLCDVNPDRCPIVESNVCHPDLKADTKLNTFQRRLPSFINYRTTHRANEFSSFTQEMKTMDGETIYFTMCPFKGGAYVFSETPPAETGGFIGYIAANTGVGKTLGVLHCSSEKDVVIMNEDLVEQWQDSVSKHFTKSDNVARIITWDDVKTKRSKPFTCRRLFIEEAHLVKKNPKWFTRLMEVCTYESIFIISATPYDVISYAKCVGLAECELPLVYDNLMIQGELDVELSISYECVPCPIRASERAFFDELASRVNNIKDLCVNKGNGNLEKIFRVMQNISAGGTFDGLVMMELIQRLFRGLVFSEHPNNEECVEATHPAVEEAECPICHDGFTNKIQTDCHHAFCHRCWDSWAHVRGMNCPSCRRTVHRLFKPYTGKDTNTDADDQRAKRRKLEELSDDSGMITISGKFEKFTEMYSDWQRTCPSDKLVIFVSKSDIGIKYANQIGAEWVGEKTRPNAALKRFKSGPSGAAIVLSTRWSSGHDIPEANHVWIMDMDRSSHKFYQSIGRIKRHSQLKDIFIKIFIYERTFDDFLYQHRMNGNMTASKGNLILFEYFLNKHKVGTPMNFVHRMLEDVCGSDKLSTYPVEGFDDRLTVNKSMVVSFKHGRISNHGYNYWFNGELNASTGDDRVYQLSMSRMIRRKMGEFSL